MVSSRKFDHKIRVDHKISGLKEGFAKNHAEDAFHSEYGRKDYIDKYVSIFIREYIQNTIDAWIKDNKGARLKKPPHIKIDIYGKKDGINTTFIKDIKTDLDPYLKATGQEVGSIDRILVYEEFECTGLTGSVDQSSDTTSHFIKFLTGSGKRAKAGGELGSEGTGKIVGYISSDIRSMFIFTRRYDDNKEYLIGKYELPHTPELKNKDIFEYTAYYFDQVKQLPIDDQQEIKQFKKDMKISRTSEPGTSFVIPYIRKEFTHEAIICSVLEEYLFAILKYEITLEVGGIDINQGNAMTLANQYLGTDEENFREFLYDCVSFPDAQIIDLNPDWQDIKKIEDTHFDPLDLNSLMTDYESGNPIAIRVPINLGEKKDNPGVDVKGSFIVFLKIPDPGIDSEMALFRKGLSIKDELDPKSSKIFCLMQIDDDNVSAFCSDSEIKNHYKFNQQKREFGEIWKTVRNLSALRNAPKYLIKYFNGTSTLIIDNLLLDLFSVVKPITPSKKDTKSKKAKKRKKTPRGTSTNYVSVKNDKHVVRCIPGRDQIPHTELPKKLEISVANAVVKGDAFSQYSPLDLNLEDKTNYPFKLKGARFIKTTDFNCAEFQILSKDFKIEISGFKRAVASKFKV
ncbi:hypothetical protein N8791_06325 [Gammaproteobacteria bacterium]|nr:hypothetical protein [Gammaproteobacteria bacterium]